MTDRIDVNAPAVQGSAAGNSATLRDLGLALIIPVSWSFSFVTGQHVMTTMPQGPATVSLLRFLVAVVVLAPMMLAGRKWVMIERRDWPRLILLALTCVPVYHYLFFRGLASSPAGMSSIVLAILPILINLAAGLFLHEPLTRRTIGGAALAFFSLVLITLDKGNWTLAGWGRGETLILLAAMVWLIYTLAGRSFFHRYNPLAASFQMFVVGIVMTIPWALIEGEYSRLTGMSWAWWGSIIYMGGIATAAGYVAFNASVRVLGAGRTALFLLLIPPLANVWGLLFFGEPLSPFKAVGIGGVLVGVWMALRR